MTLENSKTFTKVVKGKKWTLPRLVELPFDVVDALLELENNDVTNKTKQEQTKIFLQIIRILKEANPVWAEATKTLKIEDLSILLSGWFENEKKQTGTDPKK